MKTIYKKLLFILLLMPFAALAQGTLSGTVLEKGSNLPLPGVNVVVQGTTNGTSTDLDGKFQLKGLTNGNLLVFSYIGFSEQTVSYIGQQTISVTMEEDSNTLQEVVVQVGYGTTTKKDATGAVSLITTADFNKGTITSADQLLTGRAPGVRITSDGGRPDATPNIRIRGGSSLGAQNNPLIVIDGVPLDFVTPAGVSNPLSLVNPNDVESFSILKDASATAIYGSRASNGVIIITTKRGSSGKPQYNFSSTVSMGNALDQIDVMDGPTYTRFIQEYHPDLVGKLGVSSGIADDPSTPEREDRKLYNTDWYKAVTRTAIVVDQNFSARANLFGKVPFRASIGYTKNDGLIKNNDYNRYSGSIKATPSLLDDHLKIDINLKGLRAEKRNTDDVLGAAFNYDPTKPIYAETAENNFGGYYQNTTAADPRKLDGQYNPVNSLNEKSKYQEVNKLLGNVQFDYKMHFLPELKAIVNLGLEGSRAKDVTNYKEFSFETYNLNNNDNTYNFHPGEHYREYQHITNKTLDTYLSYTKSLTGILTRVDAQAGHTYQSFVNDGYKVFYQYNTTTGDRELQVNALNPNNRYYNKTVLESYFGRLNFDLANRYLFTVTMRADASSLFAKDEKWGYFPAAAFAWRVKDENFLKNSTAVNDLKLRFGYGITGQQDITSFAGYYPSAAFFAPGSTTAQYLPGASTYIARPFNDKLKWEQTTTYNAGIDFSFFKNGLLSGSVDVYRRVTDDLLLNAIVPPGQYLTNTIAKNVGSLTNKGVEVNLTLKPVQAEDYSWEVSGNLTYNIGEITKLADTDAIDAGGGLPVGTGLGIFRHKVGEQPSSAWLFEQLYDSTGNLIPGAFKDRNGDGQITNDDRYYKAFTPNWTFGFSTNFNYKKWDLSATFHGQLDGQVYNAIELQGGWTDRAVPNNTNSLSNVLDFYDGAANPRIQNIQGNIPFSDYYVENSSFLRCDNITIGYRIPEVAKNCSLRLFAGVNNAFLITNYSGQDPENFGGIDYNFYPRPRMYNFGVNLDF